MSSIKSLLSSLQEVNLNEVIRSIDEAWDLIFSIAEGQDIRTTHLNQIHQLALAYGRKNKHTLDKLDIEPEDFAQDVVVNVFRRKGLDNYDPEKTHAGFEPLIFRFAKNHLIDLTRKANAYARQDDAGRAIKPTSLNTPVGHSKMGDQEITLGDLIGDHSKHDATFSDMLRAARSQIKRLNLRRRVTDDPTRPGGKSVRWVTRRADAKVPVKMIIPSKEFHKGALYRDYLLARAGLL